MDRMTTVPVTHRAGSSRTRVLRALRGRPDGVDVRELASDLGLHANSVRFHLQRLCEEGLVAVAAQHRGEPGRPALRYTAVTRPDSLAARRDFRSLAEVLAGVVAGLGTGGEVPQAAGERWGRDLAGDDAEDVEDPREAVEVLLCALETIGFDPGTRQVDGRIEIVQRHCPFLEVAEAHRDVVCRVHLGLVQGLLGRTAAAVSIDRLVPFATAEGCVAELLPGSRAGAGTLADGDCVGPACEEPPGGEGGPG